MGEGFGLPIIESMACGTPLIATDFSAMKELVEDVGLLVKPKEWLCAEFLGSWFAMPDTKELSKKMEEMYYYEDLRKKCSKAGLKRAKEYSWDKVIHNIDKALNLALEKIKEKKKARISAIYNEDYESQWGKIDYKDKVVLDIGADIGSTADFFLRKGAKNVVAVEGDSKLYKKLEENAEKNENIIPQLLWIYNSKDIEFLIKNYSWKESIDVLKADCEGCEKHIFEIPDEVWKKVPEYIIETHSDELFEQMKKKCKINNYEIVDINEWKPTIRIVYARRKEVK